jgi:hypothetical protein
MDDGDNGAPRGKTIIGKSITIYEDITSKALSLDNIINEVKNILNINGLSDEPIKIVIGSKQT